jgi:hypothetical protein
MMDIVTGCNRESPPGFRVNPQISGAARRPCRRMTASKNNAIAPSKTMAMRRRRTPAEYAVITALISIASSVVCATQLPVTTWPRSERAHPAVNEPIHQVTADMHNAASCANELSKPPPTSNVIAAPAAWHKSALDEAYAAEHDGQGQPESGGHSTVLTAVIRPAPLGEVTPTPPQIPAPTLKPTAPPVAPPPPQAEQPLPPPRQQQRPPPQHEAPAPEPEAPAPEPEAPAPEPAAPPPQEAPPSPPPGRGHVQLAP